METELPKGWDEKELSEVATIVMGQSPPSSSYNETGDGLPFFQGKREFGNVHPVADTWCNSPLRIAESGDILMSVRAPVGSINLADQKCCIGRGLCAIRAKDGIKQKYLWFFLMMRGKEFSFEGRGTTFDSVSKKDVFGMRIPVPPLSVQEKIVARLDAFFKEYNILKAEKEKARENHEKILQSALFKTLEGYDESIRIKIGDLVEKGWIHEIKSGFPSGKHSRSGDLVHIRPMNINLKGKLDFSSCKYVSKEEKSKDYLLKKGDVIFNNTNSPELVGKTMCFDSDKDCAFSNHMTRIRVDDSKINPEFLATYLHNLWQQGYFKLICRSHVSQASVNNSMLKDVEIHLPDIKEQKKVMERLRSIEEPMQLIHTEANNVSGQVENLPHSVLLKAFKGELVA